MSGGSNLILEVRWLQGQVRMNLSGKADIAETVRHYSQCRVSHAYLSRLADEAAFFLEKSRVRPSAENSAGLRKTGFLLWEHLFTPPVRAALLKSPVCSLSLLIDEELSFCPWELAFDGREFLCLKFGVGRRLAIRSEAPPPSCPPGEKLRMLVLADPTGDLPSAYKEGVNIRKQFAGDNSRIAIDFKSQHIDGYFVKRCLRDYDIVHFAGHGEYDEDDPEGSGWLLADARFSCRDIRALGGGAPLPGLIFSNSCHSARVAPDGAGGDGRCRVQTYDQANAFLLAGVRHFLGTAHRVEDHAALLFAKAFYTALFAGKSIGDSARGARRALISAAPEGTAWAGYVLYGDPDYALPGFSFSAAPVRPGKRVSAKSIRFAALAGLTAVSVAGALIFAALSASGAFALMDCRRLMRTGRNGEAATRCELLIKSGRQGDTARLLRIDALTRMGRNDAAIRECFDYILHYGASQPARAAGTCVRIGWLYQENGEYAKAREFYERALAESRKLKDRLTESTALRKLAVWHMDKGDDNTALELLTKCLDIDSERRADPAHRYNIACDYFDMGVVFMDKGEMDTAREFYRKSLGQFARMKLTHEESDYYFNLGEIYLQEKQYPKAMASYLKGLQIDTAVGNLPSLIDDYCMIGELYAEMERDDEAGEYFRKSLETARRINDRPGIAAASFNLGLLEKKRGARNRARDYFRQAQEIYRGMGTPDVELVRREFEGLDG